MVARWRSASLSALRISRPSGKHALASKQTGESAIELKLFRIFPFPHKLKSLGIDLQVKLDRNNVDGPAPLLYGCSIAAFMHAPLPVVFLAFSGPQRPQPCCSSIATAVSSLYASKRSPQPKKKATPLNLRALWTRTRLTTARREDRRPIGSSRSPDPTSNGCPASILPYLTLLYRYPIPWISSQ